jgi:uncharacterized protein YndB with AHSA1/START domain
VELPASADGFALFTTGFARWWPAEYTWSGDALVEIGIEPREGGHCFELGPGGFRCDWGTVTAWEPPRRLVFLWQIGPGREPVPDPSRAGEVEVRFGDDGRVDLEHRGFDRHGDGGAAYADGMGSPQGWPYILKRFAAAAGS